MLWQNISTKCRCGNNIRNINKKTCFQCKNMKGSYSLPVLNQVKELWNHLFSNDLTTSSLNDKAIYKNEIITRKMFEKKFSVCDSNVKVPKYLFNINKVQKSSEWICPKCELINVHEFCVACLESSPHNNKWKCENCSSLNKLTKSKCNICKSQNKNITRCSYCRMKISIDRTVCDSCFLRYKLHNSKHNITL